MLLANDTDCFHNKFTQYKEKKNTSKYGNSVRINPIALRKAKIAYNFGLSECDRVKERS